ncbi:hypothetical protein [Halorarum salinum]|uniref:Uncharacterized protein n=1 Tax=Halorarum salinum TaxID=2743089 RepID=A0A7D5QBE9_9EURY|nr:hypothetical protein [Halobaculum salinum]QLG63097.1 hypothetical protein HUG12_15705 [Halobaculum salinum]
MKGIHRYSPTTGAELGRDRHYPGTIPLRESLEGDGELTNGELVSRDPTAILEYFKRCHRKHYDADQDLYLAAWEGITALRAGDDEEESDPWDCWLWYALAERLDRRGHDVEWMCAHVDPRCPHCSSSTKLEPSATGYPNVRCASHCRRYNDVTIAIVERVLDLYNATFDEGISRVGLF